MALSRVDCHAHWNPASAAFCAALERRGHLLALEALEKEARTAKIKSILLVGLEDDIGAEYPSRRARTPLAIDAFESIDTGTQLRAYYVAGVNPYECDLHSLMRLEAAIASQACVGVKVFLGYYPEPLNSSLYRPVFELVERHRLSVLVHTGHLYETGAGSCVTRPARVGEVAKQYPGASWVACHMGDPWYDELADALTHVPNLFADTAGISMVDFCSDQGCRLLKLARQRQFYERIVFGSDWPFFPIDKEVAAVERTFPDEAWNLVFATTPRKLFALEGST